MSAPEILAIRTLADGSVEFDALVSPGAPRSAVRGVHGGALKMAVNAPPERGKANEAAVELVAELLGVAASRVSVVSGPRSRKKRLRVTGIGAAALQLRLIAAGGGDIMKSHSRGG